MSILSSPVRAERDLNFAGRGVMLLKNSDMKQFIIDEGKSADMAQQNQTNQKFHPDYRPQMFEPKDLYEAKKISLPDYDDSSLSPSRFNIGGPGPKSEERWEKETDFIVDKILCEFVPRENSWLLDYGCGAGRIAKKLCEKKLNILGVDISPGMRKYAVEYVDNPERFLCVSPEMLQLLITQGFRVDGGFAIWTLMHVPKLPDALEEIQDVLKFGAPFISANLQAKRMLPVTIDGEGKWLEDNYDLWGMTDNFFGLRNTILFPNELDPKNKLILRSYWKTLTAPPQSVRKTP